MSAGTASPQCAEGRVLGDVQARYRDQWLLHAPTHTARVGLLTDNGPLFDTNVLLMSS